MKKIFTKRQLHFLSTQVREHIDRGETVEAYRVSARARITARVANLFGAILLKAIIVIAVVVTVTQN